MKKSLPDSISSYDLVKTAAVIIMIVDHIGYYFYPDMLWWRAVGRIGFPVWFFLVGYSTGRDLPVKLWAGGCILVVANVICGLDVFPLNALFTIMAIRLAIDPVMRGTLARPAALWGRSLILLAVAIPSYQIAEYGTQALITAIFGYLVRHRDELSDKKQVDYYMVFALVGFVAIQQLNFGFSLPQFLFVVGGTMAVRLVLYYFKPRTYQVLTGKLPAPATFFVQFCGRRTLEIYVVHLLLFKAAGMALDPARFAFLGGGLWGG